MKHKIISKYLSCFLAFSFFCPAIFFAFSHFSLADYVYTPMERIPGFETAATDFPTFVLSLYKFGIWAVGICALLMITVGGFMYLVSAGNTSKMDNAKKIITDAILGLIIALGAYFLLFIINPDLVNINISLKPFSGSGASGVSSTGAPTAVGNLATGCNNYASAFTQAAGGDKNLQCLLIAIANQESGCNPNLTSSHGACGLMQILPATAKTDCNSLLSDPSNSIQIAKNLLDSSRGNIQSHSGFNIGSSYGLSGTTVSYGSFTYDTGNDDLIASYNAGSGEVASTPGMKGPFQVSSDCPNPVTPAWQCNINPGGFSETQNYVVRVQQFQKQCLSQ